MPRRFNKGERDELLSVAKKPKKSEKPEEFDEDGASVLDALESKTAAPLINGTLEGYGGPGPSETCPECGNPLNPDGRCSNGYCLTNGGSGQQSYIPEEFHPHHQQGYEHRPAFARWSPVRVADASMPPENTVPIPETAQPYNPAAFESMVEDMHPAAKFTYERSVQQGANPQAAIQAAQQKQQEMANRALQGQNVEGVEQPVAGGMGVQPIVASSDDVEKNPVAEIITSDFGGFVPVSSVQRVSHLLS